MLELLALALIQIATLVGTPATTAPKQTTTLSATSTTTPPPPPTRIGNEGWDND